MPEHRIRLRGGWRRRDLSDPASPALSVSLPIDWDADGRPGPVRLVRQFGCPAIDRSIETVVLSLEDVPGLLAAHLNGRPVDLPAAGSGRTGVEIGALLPRNELVLDVDPARASSGSGWGQVALVVRSSEGTAHDTRQTPPTA